MNKDGEILVVGAGSIGVYLGTLLYSKGHDVTLLGRSKLKKLHDTILLNDEPYKLPNRIYSMPKNKRFEFIFITSKLYDLTKNLKLIKKNKIKCKYLISIQNGLVDESVYKPYIGKAEFVPISVFEGFRLVENQLNISLSKTGWKTENSALGRNISKMLSDAGINCSVEKDLDRIKAEKTIMNCSINLLSAIEKKTFFELCNNQKFVELMNKLFDETYNVLSHKVKLGNKEELRKKFYETVRNMRHYSSTYQDAISKRRTEIDFLNVYIIKLAKSYKINVPESEKLVNEFKKIYD